MVFQFALCEQLYNHGLPVDQQNGQNQSLGNHNGRDYPEIALSFSTKAQSSAQLLVYI